MSNHPMSHLTQIILLHLFAKSTEVSVLEEIHRHEALLESSMEVKQLGKTIVSL